MTADDNCRRPGASSRAPRRYRRWTTSCRQVPGCPWLRVMCLWAPLIATELLRAT